LATKLGLKESTVATDAATMDEDFLQKLADLIKKVEDLDNRIQANGRELDRLKVDVEFWNTVLLEFVPEDEETNQRGETNG
jgi:hypothetical protein